jgi:hypothetical protein
MMILKLSFGIWVVSEVHGRRWRMLELHAEFLDVFAFLIWGSGLAWAEEFVEGESHG